MVHAKCEYYITINPLSETGSPSYRGFSAISPDDREIVISNLSSGVEVYSLESLTKIRSFTDNMNHVNNDINQALSVAFLGSGAFVVGGSFTGRIRILDKASGAILQALHHDSKSQFVLLKS